MSEEKQILSTKEGAIVTAAIEYDKSSKMVKEVSSWILGPIPNYFIQNKIAGKASNSLKGNANIQQGEMKDIIGKLVKLKELTLTNLAFHLVYESGLISKQEKLIILPLEHAKSVTTYDVLRRKWFNVKYEVPQQEKAGPPQRFSLAVAVSNNTDWSKAITELIGSV
jgi:hypothetical protein